MDCHSLWNVFAPQGTSTGTQAVQISGSHRRTSKARVVSAEKTPAQRGQHPRQADLHCSDLSEQEQTSVEQRKPKAPRRQASTWMMPHDQTRRSWRGGADRLRSVQDRFGHHKAHKAYDEAAALGRAQAPQVQPREGEEDSGRWHHLLRRHGNTVQKWVEGLDGRLCRIIARAFQRTSSRGSSRSPFEIPFHCCLLPDRHRGRGRISRRSEG